MSQIIENKKGFKVIECSIVELAKFGVYTPVCDSCNNGVLNGFYIAVLNHWYCPACYEEWMRVAKWYAEDAYIEERNFEHAKSIL